MPLDKLSIITVNIDWFGIVPYAARSYQQRMNHTAKTIQQPIHANPSRPKLETLSLLDPPLVDLPSLADDFLCLLAWYRDRW